MVGLSEKYGGENKRVPVMKTEIGQMVVGQRMQLVEGCAENLLS